MVGIGAIAIAIGPSPQGHHHRAPATVDASEDARHWAAWSRGESHGQVHRLLNGGQHRQSWGVPYSVMHVQVTDDRYRAARRCHAGQNHVGSTRRRGQQPGEAPGRASIMIRHRTANWIRVRVGVYGSGVCMGAHRTMHGSVLFWPYVKIRWPALSSTFTRFGLF